MKILSCTFLLAFSINAYAEDFSKFKSSDVTGISIENIRPYKFNSPQVCDNENIVPIRVVTKHKDINSLKIYVQEKNNVSNVYPVATIINNGGITTDQSYFATRANLNSFKAKIFIIWVIINTKNGDYSHSIEGHCTYDSFYDT